MPIFKKNSGPYTIDQYCLNIIENIKSFSREGLISQKYNIGETILECNFFDLNSYKLFHNSMLHLKSLEASIPDWRIYLVNKKYSGPKLPKESQDTVLHQGIIEHRGSDRFQLLYIEHLKTLFALDHGSKLAVYWTSLSTQAMTHDITLPIRYITEAIYRKKDGIILHCGAIGRNGKGVLFTGKSGSGKSTTSLACLLAGFDFICDDHCLYHNEMAYSLSQFAKLNSTSLEILSPLDKKNLIIGKNHVDKAIISLLPSFNLNLKDSLKIKAIILPGLTKESKTSLIPCSAKEAFKSLAPSSFSQFISAHKQEMSLMSQLVKSVPSYKLTVNEDLNQAINFIDQLKEIQ